MEYMEARMQQQMEAGFALHEAVENAAYKALMAHLGVLHVTITNGLSSYGISQSSTQAIVDAVANEFNLELMPVVLEEESLKSFAELMSFFSNGKG